MNETKISNEKFLLLKKFANWMAAYYFSPIYLLGSSLVTENFRDVDIIVCMNEDMFEMRFGSVNEFLASLQSSETKKVFWSVVEENMKRYKEAYMLIGLTVDFKILPKNFFLESFKTNMIRLDESNF